MTKKHFEAIATIIESETVPNPFEYAPGFDEGWASRFDALEDFEQTDVLPQPVEPKQRRHND